MASENEECPSIYPYSTHNEKSLMWHLRYDDVCNSDIEFASNCLKFHLCEKRDRGENLTKAEREYLRDENTNGPI